MLDKLYSIFVGPKYIEYEEDRLIALFFSNIFSVIGFIVIMSYGLLNLSARIYLPAFMEILVAFILLSIFLYSRKSADPNSFLVVKICLILSLFGYAFVTGGSQETGFLWVYTFPVAIFAIASSQVGLLITFFFYSFLIIFYILHVFEIFTLPYELYQTRTFILSLFVVTLIIFIYKILQEKILTLVLEQRNTLRRTNQKYSSELEKKKLIEEDFKRTIGSFKKQNQLLESTKVAMINLLEDINDEKTKSKEQAESLRQFKEAVENTNDHIVFTDTEGAVIYANEAVEITTGYTKDEIIGKTPRLWGGQMPKEFYKEFWDVIKNQKKVFKGEVINRKKNGELYTAQVQVIPILGNAGEIKFFVGIERDITEDKEVEKLKSEFVSIASHQLRTPATGVKWFTELLLDNKAGELTDKQREYLKEVYHSNERMLKLINDLLNVSRIETGKKFTIEIKTTDVVELINKEVKDMLIIAEKKNIQIVKEESIPESYMIDVDPEKFRQVLKNLLDNAIKYSNMDGKVYIGLREEADNVVFWVKDEGIGIPEAQRDRIFEKFFRADNVLKADTDGTGLGLYIVKAIVEAHQGNVSFETEEGKGTTFYISFPKEQHSKESRTIRV